MKVGGVPAAQVWVVTASAPFVSLPAATVSQMGEHQAWLPKKQRDSLARRDRHLLPRSEALACSASLRAAAARTRWQVQLGTGGSGCLRLPDLLCCA